MKLAITPKSATNKLIIEVVCPIAVSVSTLHSIGSIFQEHAFGLFAREK
mgnify:CR=1 FL=1